MSEYNPKIGGGAERGPRPPKRYLTIAAALLTAGVVGACDGLLDVELPGDMTEEGLFQPAQAALVVNGVVASYECAFGSLTAANSGMESVWWRTSGFYANFAEYNENRVFDSNCSGAGSSWYVSLQSSRAMAEDIYQRLSEWSDAEVPGRRGLMMTAATYAGLGTQYLGEVMCEVAFDAGPLETQEQALKRAEEWFTRALAIDGDVSIEPTNSVRQLAHLGRARVRLALGTRYAPEAERAAYLDGAASDAAAVEPGFIAYATRDATMGERWNHFQRVHFDQRYGTIADRVPDNENGGFVPFTGYRNLTIDAQGRAVVDGTAVVDNGTPDPRVPVFNREITAYDGVSILWGQTKYSSVGDDIPMGSWDEAQLILAEIEGGQSAVERINALRDQHDLPHFSSSNATEISEAVIEERRRELFLESGTRHYVDKLRYIDSWGWFPEPGTPAMPTSYAYGSATCLLMPLSEYLANPNAEGDGSQFISRD